jgi:hypothetical protein
VVESILTDIPVARVVGKEIPIPAVDISKDRLSADSNEDFPVDYLHLPYPEGVEFVGDDEEIADEVVEGVVAGLDDFEAVGRQAKGEVVAVRVVGMVETLELLLLDRQRS